MAWLLNGCGEGPAGALLGDYQQRLAAALDLAPPTKARPTNIGDFPGPDARLFTLPETREGLLDVFALRGCHIANLVAGRNNQLGKVAAPSQRWLYELALWRRLSGCWNTEVPATLGDNDKARLARLTQLKTDQLPRASWNALFASSEWVDSFSRASSPLPPDALSEVDVQLPALAYLREATLHQFDRRWEADSATLEGHLKTLQERPLTAELLRALMLAERRLSEASRLLETALEDEACPATPAGLPSFSGDTRLVAWLDRLELASRRWLSAVHRLLDAQLISPRPAIVTYRRRWLSLEDPRAPWPALATARQRHRELRASLLRHCR
ncbi:DUF3080 family protein [Halomonas organivorans]|uniref:DUF3080 domain-containing protein n=1 Tax=Halomonas organivorans TaxID=257772 RepID=A0A7W5C1N2_9GAMM|nr:DUF3080 family protein [Halomonas organivorans]MBB3142704.1 hypothetical protein [Halomonas organivorans]